jgi:hypothetical protein
VYDEESHPSDRSSPFKVPFLPRFEVALLLALIDPKKEA